MAAETTEPMAITTEDASELPEAEAVELKLGIEDFVALVVELRDLVRQITRRALVRNEAVLRPLERVDRLEKY
ncbi:hypothetical protein DVH05_009045 [Phytophthora capsici]|nr:hypothetical protein DVH05_009045 [Phytophthora capsici]